MGLTVLGTNAMTLTASNGFTGSTTVSSGTLVLANTGALGGSTLIAPRRAAWSSLRASPATPLRWAAWRLGEPRFARQCHRSYRPDRRRQQWQQHLCRRAEQSRALTKVGTGLLTLIGSNTYSGNTTVSGGTLQVGDGSAGHDGSLASMSLSLSNNAALFYNLSGSETYGGAISGTGSLSKTGTGSLILSGVNNYSGVTTVNAARWRS